MTGFDTFRQSCRDAGWQDIERESGLAEPALRAAADVYMAAENVIAVYGMGLTRHTHGALNIAMLVNLLLLRGNIGRPGAGICPVRGHSNVQGQRTVGIAEKTKLVPLEKLKALFGFDPPATDSMNIVAAAEVLAGDTDFVRIDFYEIDGMPRFGEFCVYPGSGLDPFAADWIDLEPGGLWCRALHALNSGSRIVAASTAQSGGVGSGPRLGISGAH